MLQVILETGVQVLHELMGFFHVALHQIRRLESLCHVGMQVNEPRQGDVDAHKHNHSSGQVQADQPLLGHKADGSEDTSNAEDVSDESIVGEGEGGEGGEGGMDAHKLY